MSKPNAPRDSDGTLSKIRRYPGAGWVAGVCAGIADYFGWNLKLIRVLWVLALVFTGFFPAGVVYLALWFLMDPADGRPEQQPSHRSDGVRLATLNISPGDVRQRFEKLERRLQQIEACVTQEELDLRRQFRNLET
ncbi:phage shock protein C (PspC) family protein [Solimonas aquatica]|uniref:Phage shock protein C (PspC) family protein n=1 Tax=Solimonas aquatica TaxID=489703 RepID=A0A1H8ZMT2_9GAMM|nr:PspC domain-containing protein [Solimonas aquatica]SEP65008.1 phage shock protein C (PspC) family protein [Solimonas aquatica]